jgi:S-(hydroxymethyl)glutathione dehydrogenase / alcohol dehydrogenase
MRIDAAILWEAGQPLAVEAADLDPPGPGEVLVEVRAAGVCHSDLHPARGDWPIRAPIVLGHEGAGIVRDVGAGVDATQARPGDRVVFSWAPACGVCPPCREGRYVLCDRVEKVTFRNRLPSGASRLHARGRDIAPFLGTACFASFAVVPADALIVVPSDVPFDALATVGCAVVTGVGAVLNAAQVPAGSRVAVIGAGGVGLNVVQGAAIAGCSQVIAVDVREAPLAHAQRFGATHTLASGDATGAIRDLTSGRGVDFAFDTVGNAATLSAALACTKKGGTVVLTGLSRLDAQGAIQMFPFVMQEKRLIGSVYGSGEPRKDIPRLVSLFREGRLKLRELAAREYPLEGINTALDALAAADGARGIITF